MSYRSEVRCLIYGDPKTMETFLTKENTPFIQDEEMKRDQQITRYRSEVESSSDDAASKEIEILDLNGAGWKWYANINEVSDWYRFMDEAYRAGLAYEFLRVGEGIYQGVYDIEYYCSEGSLTLLKVNPVGLCEPVARHGENIPLP